MERVAGLEPASSAWKAEAQPLYHARRSGPALDLAFGAAPKSRGYESRALLVELGQNGSETENRTRVGRLPSACSATELSQNELNSVVSRNYPGVRNPFT